MNSSKFRTINKPVQWRLQTRERQVILLTGDIFVSILAMALAIFFWAQGDWLNISIDFIRERVSGWFFYLPILWLLLLIELYDVKHASNRQDTLRSLGIAATASIGLYLIIFFFAEPNTLPRVGVAVYIAAAALFTLFWRLIYIQIFTAPQFLRRVLIVGAGRAGTTLATVAAEIWPPPFHLVGFIDDDPDKIGAQIQGVAVLGGGEEMLEMVTRHKITDIIFAISGEMNPEMFEALMKVSEQGIVVTTMPMLYEELLGRVPIALLQSDWILRSFVDQAHTSTFYELGKRLMDIFGALVGLFITLFLTPLIALIILLDDGFPIFYSQERLGKNGRLYKIIKFRTMIKDAEKDGKPRLAVENDERVTRSGKLLRKSHLDEFPNFLNVLNGDMSLVGPRAERPSLVEQLEKVVPFYRARLMVTPGLTGWAQVNFKYASTVEDTAIKLEYDLYYIKHRNLFLDISILLKTVGTVFGFKGQ